jgi:H2-forming N5,N10-methylenetetrahydromethanopterin dehydrogenase-like enzyme
MHFQYHSKEIIKIPSPPEQQKIANTLSTLDSLIEAQNQQINHLKQHKKGLMQLSYRCFNIKTLTFKHFKKL